MAEDENEDTYLDRPNRRKASSKATKAIVALLLIVSAVIVIIISVGGWDTLEGAKPLQIAYIVIYLVMAFLVMRWNRGVLPLAAALAIVLLIFAAVSGPAWFDRDKTGLTDPTLDEDILGLLSLILVPIQILLIAFAMRGFQQAWNVEVERSTDERGAARARPRTRLSHALSFLARPGGGMADTAVSKAAARESVRVRIPPRALRFGRSCRREEAGCGRRMPRAWLEVIAFIPTLCVLGLVVFGLAGYEPTAPASCGRSPARSWAAPSSSPCSASLGWLLIVAAGTVAGTAYAADRHRRIRG